MGLRQAGQAPVGLLATQTLQQFAPGTYDPEQDTWELYYLPDDFSQARDLAAQNPEKLAELKELFWQEAERNRVLPLLAGFAVFFGMLPPMPTRTRFEFAGDVQNIQTTMIPRIYGRSYAIEAEVTFPTAAPRACCAPSPTSSVGSRSGSTRRGC